MSGQEVLVAESDSAVDRSMKGNRVEDHDVGYRLVVGEFDH
jgi:hypothetical protein